MRKAFNSVFVVLIFFVFSCEENGDTNIPPTGSITSPENSSIIILDSIITVSVNADDADGSISEVKYLINGTLKKTVQNSPFSFSWNTSEESEGEYSIAAYIIDDRGDGTRTEKINVLIIESGTVQEPPVAYFSLSDSLIQISNSIQFTDLSTNKPYRWNWDFGDGGTSTEQNPSHTYYKTGLYTVSLTSHNYFGSDSVIKTDIIAVIDDGDLCPGCPDIDSVTDFDGNVYSTIEIGTQLWMSENLKTLHYNNGEEIPLVTDNAEWENITSGAYSWYENDSATYHNTYGPLYNWYAVNTKKLCPTGWRVPNEDDWYNLSQELGGQPVSAGQLKEPGTEHWDNPNIGATTRSGFNALPGGFRTYLGNFFGRGEYGKYWISNKMTSGDVQIREIENDSEKLFWYSYTEAGGISVRCIKK